MRNGYALRKIDDQTAKLAWKMGPVGTSLVIALSLMGDVTQVGGLSAAQILVGIFITTAQALVIDVAAFQAFAQPNGFGELHLQVAVSYNKINLVDIPWGTSESRKP